MILQIRSLICNPLENCISKDTNILCNSGKNRIFEENMDVVSYFVSVGNTTDATQRTAAASFVS